MIITIVMFPSKNIREQGKRNLSMLKVEHDQLSKDHGFFSPEDF